MARHSITVAFAALAAACSSGQPSKGSPFSSLGGATQPVVDDADEDDDGESGSSSGKGSDETGGTSGDPFGDADTSATAMTSGGPGDSSGGVGTTTGAGDESSTGVFMPGNGQPAMGMYADCFEPDFDNCNAFAPVCLMSQPLMSGFCTHDMCSVPADCNPAPLDASATPICVQGESPRGQDVGLCALDCSGGRSCPAGMQCAENVSFGEGFPSYDFCI